MRAQDELSDYVIELHKRLTPQQLGGLLAENYEIEQALGKAMGYPKAFPDVGEVDDGSVVTAPHTPLTLAQEAASYIRKLQKDLEDAKRRTLTVL